MSDEPKKDEQTPEVKTELSGESLPESELKQVAGGTASPNLFSACVTGKHIAKAKITV
jgi:type VI protein secretion system component Hcp